MSELTTDQKGAIAELAIAQAAAVLGAGVFKPLTDGERYDLIFDHRPRLVRVQCKWASRLGDVLIVRCRSWRRSRAGLVHREYSSSEIDAIAAYSHDLACCYFLPIDRLNGRSTVQLRLKRSRNNQWMGVNWAEDFSFDAKLTPLLGP